MPAKALLRRRPRRLIIERLMIERLMIGMGQLHGWRTTAILSVNGAHTHHEPATETRHCAARKRDSIASTAPLATASLAASRARRTTLVFGPRCSSKNG